MFIASKDSLEDDEYSEIETLKSLYERAVYSCAQKDVIDCRIQLSYGAHLSLRNKVSDDSFFYPRIVYSYVILLLKNKELNRCSHLVSKILTPMLTDYLKNKTPVHELCLMALFKFYIETNQVAMVREIAMVLRSHGYWNTFLVDSCSLLCSDSEPQGRITKFVNHNAYVRFSTFHELAVKLVKVCRLIVRSGGCLSKVKIKIRKTQPCSTKTTKERVVQEKKDADNLIMGRPVPICSFIHDEATDGEQTVPIESLILSVLKSFTKCSKDSHCESFYYLFYYTTKYGTNNCWQEFAKMYSRCSLVHGIGLRAKIHSLFLECFSVKTVPDSLKSIDFARELAVRKRTEKKEQVGNHSTEDKHKERRGGGHVLEDKELLSEAEFLEMKSMLFSKDYLLRRRSAEYFASRPSLIRTYRVLENVVRCVPRRAWSTVFFYSENVAVPSDPVLYCLLSRRLSFRWFKNRHSQTVKSMCLLALSLFVDYSTFRRNIESAHKVNVLREPSCPFKQREPTQSVDSILKEHADGRLNKLKSMSSMAYQHEERIFYLSFKNETLEDCRLERNRRLLKSRKSIAKLCILLLANTICLSETKETTEEKKRKLSSKRTNDSRAKHPSLCSIEAVSHFIPLLSKKKLKWLFQEPAFQSAVGPSLLLKTNYDEKLLFTFVNTFSKTLSLLSCDSMHCATDSDLAYSALKNYLSSKELFKEKREEARSTIASFNFLDVVSGGPEKTKKKAARHDVSSGKPLLPLQLCCIAVCAHHAPVLRMKERFERLLTVLTLGPSHSQLRDCCVAIVHALMNLSTVKLLRPKTEVYIKAALYLFCKTHDVSSTLCGYSVSDGVYTYYSNEEGREHNYQLERHNSPKTLLYELSRITKTWTLFNKRSVHKKWSARFNDVMWLCFVHAPREKIRLASRMHAPGHFVSLCSSEVTLKNEVTATLRAFARYLIADAPLKNTLSVFTTLLNSVKRDSSKELSSASLSWRREDDAESKENKNVVGDYERVSKRELVLVLCDSLRHREACESGYELYKTIRTRAKLLLSIGMVDEGAALLKSCIRRIDEENWNVKEYVQRKMDKELRLLYPKGRS